MSAPLDLAPLDLAPPDAPAVDVGPALPWWRVGSPLAWGVLVALLLAVAIGAVSFDWGSRKWFVGDEATYAMQAASLAFDLDLTYERKDYDRFVAHWGRPPEGLILQSTDGGRHVTFGKPPLYALAIAPFVRVAPQHGPLVANVLFLALALVLLTRALIGVAGGAAPLWAATVAFASVTFAYAFWIHADLFLFCLATAGLALVVPGVGPVRRPGSAGPAAAQVYDGALGELGGGDDTGDTAAAIAPRRWPAAFLAGILLGAVGAGRPPYLVLLLPGLMAVRGRRRGVLAFLGGAALVMLVTIGLQLAAGGDWTAYGGDRRGFYPQTGFPGVDFPLDRFDEKLDELGDTTWLRQGFLSSRQSIALWSWNGLYFLVGRHVGVLPYLAPLLLGLFAAGRGGGRWALSVAFLIGSIAFLALSPFNFYGGTGAIANRYVLPLYPALVLLAGRPLGRWAAWALPVIVTLLAAPFLYPTWRAPRQFPIDASGRYAHVSALAQRYLPYETTLSHIPGGRDVAHQGVWLKFLSDAVWPEQDGARLALLGGSWGELLVGSPVPLARLTLAFDSKSTANLEVEGGTAGDTGFHPDGSVSFAIELGPERAVHPMWWTWDPYRLYRVRLRLPGNPVPVRFTITPQARPSA